MDSAIMCCLSPQLRGSLSKLDGCIQRGGGMSKDLVWPMEVCVVQLEDFCRSARQWQLTVPGPGSALLCTPPCTLNGRSHHAQLRGHSEIRAHGKAIGIVITMAGLREHLL